MKRKLYGAGIAVGAFMMVTGSALSLPAVDVVAQAQPSPSPAASPAVAPAPAQAPKPTGPAPAPVASPVAKPVGAATTPPRAGGFPLELALPLVAGGAAAAGAGTYMLRRGRRRD